MADQTAGKRRPDPEDLEPLLDMVAEGKSLRAACESRGMDPPSTHRWLKADTGRWGQYEAAKEMRGEHYQEEVLTVTRAAALGLQIDGKVVDPAGARAYTAAVQWAVGRMAPKSGPIHRVDLTSRTRQMTDDEIAAEIAAMEAAKAG